MFVVCLLMLGAVNLFAQEQKAEDEKAKPSAQLETVQLATQLAKYGYKNASVLALVQAADMLAAIGKQELGEESFEQSAGDAPDAQKAEKVSFDVETLLKDAEEMADGDAALTAMINSVRQSATRGAVGGSRSGTHKLPANSYHTFRYKFYANSRASVVLSGDGDTDLDVYVYDVNGNLITKDDDYSDDCVCSWYPAWTGLFTIKVVNRGNVWNRYSIWIE